MHFKRNRKTKIVATLGPASSTPEMVRALFEAGADIFRMNFSHGTHEDHKKRLDIIRAVEKDVGRPIGVFADLQGPKLRLGTFKDGFIDIEKGMRITLDSDPTPGTQQRVYLPHPEILEVLVEGADVLLDDGKVHLHVVKKGKDFVETEVIAGKRLSDRKGVNLPNVLLKVSVLTDKDRRDLEAAIAMGVEWIALSFVQTPQDVAEARKLIDGRAKVMVKLEKPSAIAQLEPIIDLADAVMLARGDLGVEIPAEKVPSVQKRVVRHCRQAGKPVIIATQMLESMISSPMPTRAEVSDVANAVFDGADAIMLSAESAVGQYPVEAIQMMDKIAIEVEHDPIYEPMLYATQTEPQPTGADAIAAAASAIADTVKLGAIVCYTATGSTVLRVTRERPGIPVIGLTPIESTARRLSLVWGVQTILTGDPENLSHMVRKACRIAFEEGLVKAREGVLITAGIPLGSPGTTNMIRIAFVDESGAPIAEEV